MSTYTPIANITLASTASSVTFTGIPQNYTDLVLTASGSLTTETAMTLRFNDDSANNYSISYLYGNGTSAIASSEGPQSVVDVFYMDDNQSNTGIAHIMNYANSTTKKTVISRAAGTESLVISYVGLWQGTAAITSITVLLDAGSMNSGMTLNLYGINAELSAQAKATGGDSIVTDGTYWYHTFFSSGTFTPTQALTADYLVVAGGGAGGFWQNAGGGGGAGGLRCTVTATGGGGSLESAISLTNGTAYTITVGAGGASAGVFQTAGSQGSNSAIAGSGLTTITATGGGGGGSGYSNNNGAATTGGSGGGGWAIDGNMFSNTGAAGTTNQGYAGGNGVISGSYGFAGGGGGAGEAGNTDGQGEGGDGVSTSISGTSVTYAGGGGGGKDDRAGGTPGGGGAGGGGQGGGGSGNRSATNATVNTGGGGGGGGASGTSVGLGGSGIVIVRYAV